MPCFDCGFFGKDSEELLNEALKESLNKLRPNMISLVEYKAEWDNWFCDTSAIGNQYGDIHESFLNFAMDSRLNETPVKPFWKDTVRPMLKGE
jgi:hypothetical protein